MTLGCSTNPIGRNGSGRDPRILILLLWIIAVLIVGIVVGGRVWRLANASSPWDIVGLIYDDAYYYLTVAANTVETGHSTLDGSTLTNGFQPLWFLMATALGAVVGTGAMRYYAAFIVMMCGILVLSILLGVPRWKSDQPPVRTAISVGIAIGAVLYSRVFLSGMETVLLLPLVIPLVLLLERELTRKRAIFLSGVFAIAFLVRLDTLVLIPAYVAVIGLEHLWHRRSHKWQHESDERSKWSWILPLWLLVVITPVVLAYSIINILIYDTPVPVSGLAKSIGPSFENWGILAGFWVALAWWTPLLKLLLVLLVIEVVAYRSGVRTLVLLRSIAIFSLAICMQAVYYSTASTWGLWDWYYYFLGFILILVVARIFLLGIQLWKQQSAVLASGALAFVLVISLYAGNMAFRDLPQPIGNQPKNLGSDASLLSTGRTFTYNEISLIMLSDFFASSSRSPALVAMGDRAGGLSYWGRNVVDVVHTEGLLLGISYIEARRAGKANEYLSELRDLKYFIVDRDLMMPINRPDGQSIYVVAEPIQALRTDSNYHVALFCFPREAIRYSLKYQRSTGPSVRTAFDFDRRVSCTESETSLITEAIADSSLRQQSLPNEYR